MVYIFYFSEVVLSKALDRMSLSVCIPDEELRDGIVPSYKIVRASVLQSCQISLKLPSVMKFDFRVRFGALVVVGLAVFSHGFDVRAERSPPSCWDAVFQIGYDPPVEKVNHTLYADRVLALDLFFEATRDGLLADPSVRRTLRDTQSSVRGLNAERLYRLMTHHDSNSKWRGIGFRGGIRDGARGKHVGEKNPSLSANGFSGAV